MSQADAAGVAETPELARPLTIAGAVGGLIGANLYYLAEHAGSLLAMELGGMGFAWHGGFPGDALAVAAAARPKPLHAG